MIVTHPHTFNPVQFPDRKKAKRTFKAKQIITTSNSSKDNLLRLRLDILKLLLELNIVNTEFSLVSALKSPLYISKNKLSALLKQKIGPHLDVGTFIKQGHDEIKRLDSSARSYIRGSTVFSKVDFYAFLKELIGAYLDLSDESNKSLDSNLKILAKSIVPIPQDLDLIDISICDPTIAKAKMDNILINHSTSTSLIPTENPLYSSPDPYALITINTPTIKIDRLIGIAKTYSLFFPLGITTESITVPNSRKDREELVSLEENSTCDDILVHFIFNILQFNYIHFCDFGALLATISKLAEGGILIETVYNQPSGDIYCTLENAIHHHLVTVRENCVAFEEMLRIIFERTKKHSFDLLSYYLNILIFFKQVAKDNEPILERLWGNAKDHLQKTLSLQNTLSSLETTILQLLKDNVSLDKLLHSLYDLALLSHSYSSEYTTTFSDMGRPLIYFKFDNTCLIFPIGTPYFTHSNSTFVFRKQLESLHCPLHTAATFEFLAEQNQRIFYLQSQETYSHKVLLFYYSLQFQDARLSLSPMMQDLLSEISNYLDPSFTLSNWIQHISTGKSSLDWMTSLILAGYLNVGLKLCRAKNCSEEDLLLISLALFKYSPPLLDSFLTALHLTSLTVSKLFYDLIHRTALSVDQLHMISGMPMFYSHLTTKLMDEFLEKHLYQNSSAAAYRCFKKLEKYLPIGFQQESIALNRIKDTLSLELAHDRVNYILHRGILEEHQVLFKDPYLKNIIEQSKENLLLITSLYSCKIDGANSLHELTKIEALIFSLPSQKLPFLCEKLLKKALSFKQDVTYPTWLNHLTRKIFALNLEQEDSIAYLLFLELKNQFNTTFFYEFKNTLEINSTSLNEHAPSELLELYYQYNIKSTSPLNIKYSFEDITSQDSLRKTISIYFRGLELNYFKLLKPQKLTQIIRGIQKYSHESISTFCNLQLKEVLRRLSELDQRIYVRDYLFSFLNDPHFFIRLLKMTFTLLPAQVKHLGEELLETKAITTSKNKIYQSLTLDLLNSKVIEQLETGTLRDLEDLIQDTNILLLIETSLKDRLIECLNKHYENIFFIYNLTQFEKLCSKINFAEKSDYYERILIKGLEFKSHSGFKGWFFHLTKTIFNFEFHNEPSIQNILYTEIEQFFHPEFFIQMKELLATVRTKIYQNPSQENVTLLLQYNIEAFSNLNLKAPLNFSSPKELKTSLNFYFRGVKLKYFAPLEPEVIYDILKLFNGLDLNEFEKFCQVRLPHLLKHLPLVDQPNVIEESLLLYIALPERFLLLMKTFSKRDDLNLLNFFEAYLNLENWSALNCFTLFELLSKVEYSFIQKVLPLLANKVKGHLQDSLQLIQWILHSELEEQEALLEIIAFLEKPYPELLLPILNISFKTSSEKLLAKLLPILVAIPWSRETTESVIENFEALKNLNLSLKREIFDKVLITLKVYNTLPSKLLDSILLQSTILNDSQGLLLLNILMGNHLHAFPEKINDFFILLNSKIEAKECLKEAATILCKGCKDPSIKSIFEPSLQFIFKHWPELFTEFELSALTSINDSKESFWKYAEEMSLNLSHEKKLDTFLDHLITYATIDKIPLIQRIFKHKLIQRKYSNQMKEFELKLLETFLKNQTSVKQLLPLLAEYQSKKKYYESVSALINKYLDQIIATDPPLNMVQELLKYLIYFNIPPSETRKSFFTLKLNIHSITSLSDFLKYYLSAYENKWFVSNHHLLNFHIDLLDLTKRTQPNICFKDLLSLATKLILPLPEDEQLLYVQKCLKHLDVCYEQCALFLLWTLEFAKIDSAFICHNFLEDYNSHFDGWKSKALIDLLNQLKSKREFHLISHSLLKLLIQKEVAPELILNPIESLFPNQSEVLIPFFKKIPKNNVVLLEGLLRTISENKEDPVYSKIFLEKVDFNDLQDSILLQTLQNPTIFSKNQDLCPDERALSFYVKIQQALSKISLKTHLKNLILFRQTFKLFSQDWAEIDAKFIEQLRSTSHSIAGVLGFLSTLLDIGQNQSNFKQKIQTPIIKLLEEQAHTWAKAEHLIKAYDILSEFYKKDSSCFKREDFKDYCIKLLQHNLLVEAFLFIDPTTQPQLHKLYQSRSYGNKTQLFLSEDMPKKSLQDFEEILYEFLHIYPDIYKATASYNSVLTSFLQPIWQDINTIFIHLIFHHPAKNIAGYFYQLLAFNIGHSSSLNPHQDQDYATCYFNLRSQLISKQSNLDSLAETYVLRLLKLSEALHGNYKFKVPLKTLCSLFTDYIIREAKHNDLFFSSNRSLLEKITYLQISLADLDNAKALNEYKILFKRICGHLILPSNVFVWSLNLALFQNGFVVTPIEPLESAITNLTLSGTPYALSRAMWLFTTFFYDLVHDNERWKKIFAQIEHSFLTFPMQHPLFEIIMDSLSGIFNQNHPIPLTQKTKVFDTLFSFLKNYFIHHNAKGRGTFFVISYLYKGYCHEAIDINRYLLEIENLFGWGLESDQMQDPIFNHLHLKALDEFYPQRTMLLEKWITCLIESTIPRNFNLGIKYYAELKLPSNPSSDLLMRIEEIKHATPKL